MSTALASETLSIATMEVIDNTIVVALAAGGFVFGLAVLLAA